MSQNDDDNVISMEHSDDLVDSRSHNLRGTDDKQVRYIHTTKPDEELDEEYEDDEDMHIPSDRHDMDDDDSKHHIRGHDMDDEAYHQEMSGDKTDDAYSMPQEAIVESDEYQD